MLTNSKKFAALLFAFGLTAAACGSTAEELAETGEDLTDEVADVVAGDDAMEDDAMEDDDAETETSGDDAMEDDAMEDEDDNSASDIPATVVDIATSSDDFSILVTALGEAGLVETLQGDGPFTVFAPTNDAFETLLENGNITAEQLLAVEDLGDVLTYHVVSGNVLAEDAIALAGESVGAISGDRISIDVLDDMVVLNGESVVITADLVAGNGVVHVIDSVLLASDSSN